MNVAVTILRLKEGLDCSEVLADVDDAILKASNKKTKGNKDTLDTSGNYICRANKKMTNVPIQINSPFITTTPGNETKEEFTASTETNIQTKIKSTDRGVEPESKKKKKKAEQNLPFRYAYISQFLIAFIL